MKGLTVETTILVALIGAIVALITSIISIIGTIISSNLLKKANKELEQLKLDQDRVRIIFEINKNYLNEKLKALETASTTLQKIRDEIRIFIASVNRGDIELDRLATTCREVMNVYQSKHPYLDDLDRKRLHEVNKLMIVVIENLELIKMAKESKMDEYLQRFNRVIERLTEIQKEILATHQSIVNAFADWNIQRQDSGNHLKKAG